VDPSALADTSRLLLPPPPLTPFAHTTRGPPWPVHRRAETNARLRRASAQETRAKGRPLRLGRGARATRRLRVRSTSRPRGITRSCSKPGIARATATSPRVLLHARRSANAIGHRIPRLSSLERGEQNSAPLPGDIDVQIIELAIFNRRPPPFEIADSSTRTRRSASSTATTSTSRRRRSSGPAGRPRNLTRRRAATSTAGFLEL